MEEAYKKQKYYQNKGIVIKEYAYHENMNYPIRQSMEDSHFEIDDIFVDGTCGLFSVLDGHGGSDVVQHCAANIPQIFKQEYELAKGNIPNYQLFFQNVFKKIDDQLKLVGAADCGSCCCVVLVRKEGNFKKCYIANLGDTRAVLNENDKPKRVSTDHKAINEKEQERVKKEGGMIIRNRVSGVLAVTRALGDLDLKQEGVSYIPDLDIFQISEATKYLIIASDGLWDIVDDQKAIDLTKSLKNPEEMCKVLVEYALNNGSRDNVTVLILKFNQ